MGQHLTVYHIRSRIADTITDSYSPLLRKPTKTKAYDLAHEMPFEARLFIAKPKLKPPQWVKFLSAGFEDLPIPTRKNINAVLFVRIPYGDKKEIFAFTFGQGRHLLRRRVYDDNCGLKVSLNAMYQEGAITNPNRVKTIGTKILGENILRKEERSDRSAPIETFSVDRQGDIVTDITCVPADIKSWGNQLSGSSSLTSNPTITFNQLGDYCKAIMDHFSANWYQQDFNWVDDKKPVNDPDMLGHLMEKVIEAIKTTSDNILVTIPYLINLEDVTNVYLLFGEHEEPFDPYLGNISLVLVTSGFMEELSPETLTDEWKLVVEYADEEPTIFSVFECLSGEIKTEYGVETEKTYVLSEGQFYQISDDFIGQLNNFIRSIPERKGYLPVCKDHVSEGEYNQRAADENMSLLLLDKQLVKFKGNTSLIEICDLLSDDGRFIHIKRKFGSSGLSHLFAQGHNSADLLLKSSDFRLLALDRIKEQEKKKILQLGTPSIKGKFCFFDEREINYGAIEVTYGIIAKWNEKELAEALPFFSKITLRKFADDLLKIGVKVSYARVDVQD